MAQNKLRTMQRAAVVGVVILILAVVVLYQPERPDALITRTAFGGSGYPTLAEHFYSVGTSSTVLLTENLARFDLSTNGLPEAQIEFRGAPPLLFSQRWLGMWPSLARADLQSILVVGLGGGIVLEGVPPDVQAIDVVELEADVVRANAAIAQRRVVNPLADPAINVVINDARNALRLTDKQFDAIISQPSHPWTAGASHLFTQEFFALISSRLSAGGVFVQWMNAEFLDATLFRRLLATLLAEFRFVRVYQPTSLALHFIASDQPIRIPEQYIEAQPLTPAVAAHFARNGMNGPTDLYATLLLDDTGSRALAAELQPITDNDNRMALDSNVSAEGIGIDLLTELTAQYDPLLNIDSAVRRSLSNDELIYVTWRALADGQTPRVERIIETVDNESLRALLQALLLRYRGQTADAAALLNEIPAGDPAFGPAALLRVVDELPLIAAGHTATSKLPATPGSADSLDAVVSGWRALAAGDWPRISALDAQLAAVPHTSLWTPYAVQLRAAWRLQADDPQLILASEALILLDEVLASWPTLDGYVQRARAAQLIDDPWAFVESVFSAVWMIDQRFWNIGYYGAGISAAERSLFASHLQSFAASLALETESDRTFGRAELVLAEVQRLLNQLAFY